MSDVSVNGLSPVFPLEAFVTHVRCVEAPMGTLQCWSVMKGRLPSADRRSELPQALPGQSLPPDAALHGLLGCLLEASRLLQLFPDYVAVSRYLSISQAVRCLFRGRAPSALRKTEGSLCSPQPLPLLGR